jgi:pyruvate dehydrogenase E2 component (dihydrolipoamide acetyltransferase)
MFKTSSRSFSGKLPEHIVLTMPNLSPTMETGNLAKWLKQVGDEVMPGDILAEVETDKATVDFEMQEEGYVAKLLVEEGSQDIPIGQLVAIIVSDKEDVAAFKDFKGDATPAPAKAEAPAQAAPVAAAPSTPAPTSEAPAHTFSAPSGDRTFASPFAQKMALEKGLDINAVNGTGPSGRVIAADVNEYTPAKTIAQAVAPTASAAFADLPTTQVRKIIAKRLTESKQTIPHYYVSVECEVDNLLKLRSRLNEHSKSKISVNDMLIKAASMAALKVPSTNSSWQESYIREYKNVDMSVAVSTPTGLITPIIKSANVKGLERIATEMKDLATRAKDNKLKLDEFQGGTFSISNMGMFGVNHFTAIINPPQSCILAIGSAIKRVLPNENATGEADKYRAANVLTVTLSSDHRTVDGADAAKWTQHFKRYIETPELMLL